MAAVGRAWGWLRSWGAAPRGPGAWTSWPWRKESSEQFWEAQEELEPRGAPGSSSWWRSLWAPPTHRKSAGGAGQEVDAELSDYGTPPPSPAPPPPVTSPFRLFPRGLSLEVLPEHHHICFNFLRHLFDLMVVGFLWSVTPPTQLLLEVLGVRGPLRLWLQGMAMFLTSTLGMAGLLWWVQEYLPQIALVYGVVQALVISVSVRKSVILGEDEEQEEQEEQRGREEGQNKDQLQL